MDIEFRIRQAMSDIADDAPSVDGLAATVLRRARRRQHTTRAAIAGTAVAVTIPVGVGVWHDPEPRSSMDPATSGPAAEPKTEEPDPPEPDVLPAPASHQLGTHELVAAFETCRQSFDGEGGDGYDGWEPVFGITIDDADVSALAPVTWVAARRDDDYRADCALDSSGWQVSGVGAYGAKSTPDLLYALVDGQEGDRVGRYVEPVARVTVQYQDGPEQEAVLHGGFWFGPMDDAPSVSADKDKSSSPEEREQSAEAVPGDTDLIGVPAGYTYRGYDADGRLVYDSTTDGPSVEDCYADPTGTEIVGNAAGHSDPSECIATHQWQPLL